MYIARTRIALFSALCLKNEMLLYISRVACLLLEFLLAGSGYHAKFLTSFTTEQNLFAPISASGRHLTLYLGSQTVFAFGTIRFRSGVLNMLDF